MDTHDFEFLISQYADGTLPEQERVVVEERLRTDPAGQKLLREYEQMRQLLAEGLAPLPMIDWDRAANRISRTILDRNAPPLYSLGLYRFVVRAGFAVAAVFLLALGMWRVFTPVAPHEGPSVAPVSPLVSVAGPEAKTPAGMAELDISIGGPREAETAMRYIYDDSVLVKRSVIALDGFSNQQMDRFH